MARKLKVFLSSTANDLAAFRRAAHTRLVASPLFECIRQEGFGAQPHPAPALCKTQVEQCDIFVGLIGMRRGWEPPGDNPEHRSITEMEYDWAKDVAPRFMYVAPDDFPVPGNLRETDEEHRRHLGFRQRIMSELVISQEGFASPEALAILIVDRLTGHVLKGDLVERVRSKPPAHDDALKHLPVAEQLLQLLEERGMLKTAERGGLERDIVLKLARRIRPDEALDFDRAVLELENAVNIALDAIARGRRGSNEDAFVNDVLKVVAAHTQAGETERAVKTLDDALNELDVRATEQREILKRSRLTLLEAGIEQDILRRNASSAARRVEQSVAVEHPDNTAARLEALLNRQNEFYIEGRDKGVNFSLEIAIEIARIQLGAADTANWRGAVLNDLGVTVYELAKRESGTARLDEAVAAYREALKEGTRERVPLDWAMTQNNLGTALQTLGERESGTARLEETAAAYREALKESTRERVPLQWATIQHNLGNALQTLGERKSDTARLDEAVAAYREALKEWTRERVPLDWAMSTGNQGVALMQLADGRSNAAMAATAVDQIEQAFVVMRDGGHVPYSQYYEAQLPEARAIRDRLNKA